MLVAVQGCSHGSLTTIYDSVAQYENQKLRKVDLLLLCGDFQALRSEHDFASLAVPPKYHNLGTFQEYYSGKREAPVLTIVIGGNHEASNYMWELYHGGWLAPNIYYLGAAGSVMVDGVRIVGASGIYKDHDYRKGHFEKVPYNNSTMRSIYHIRHYDVTRLMQLPRRPHTIFLSHDWPISIPHYGDEAGLLRRKPFFRSEVETDTLGSPPLLNLLRCIQPEHWFAAHLHVKFAAVYEHPLVGEIAPKMDKLGESSSHAGGNPDEIAIEDEEPFADGPGNPDEIAIDDEDDEGSPQGDVKAVENPEEITIEDDEFDDPPTADHLASTNIATNGDEPNEAKKVEESVDLVETLRKEEGDHAAEGVIGAPQAAANLLQPNQQAESSNSGRSTKFLALDKCGPGKDFIQFLDIPSPSTSAGPARLTFDPEWLAITRAYHPYLSLDYREAPSPLDDSLEQAVEHERQRIRSEGLLVPALGPSEGLPELVWDKGSIDVTRVQQFWPTAAAHGQPGGSSTAWYTNPQTEALCGMLGLENKINPAPPLGHAS